MPKRPRNRPFTRPLPSRKAARPTVEAVEARRLLATLTVNTIADDATPDGTLSLREAIEVANGTLALNALSAQEQAQVSGALSVPNTIAFNIPGAGVQSILVGTPLPAISNGLIVDGYTQPGASPNTLANADDAVLKVQLVGNRLFPGLQVDADGVVVRGLAMFGFTDAIDIGSGAGARVEGNFLGTDSTGAVALGNAGYGVAIASGNNVIGGAAPSRRNLIVSNDYGGIIVESEVADAAPNNAIEGNFIGIGAAPRTLLSNGGDGVALLLGATGTTIGGGFPGMGNVISGNAGNGLRIATSSNTVQGNLIGTDSSGTFFQGNDLDGVSLASAAISAASFNLIGGTGPGQGNVLSGNFHDGLGIASYSNAFDGSVVDATGNVVAGNLIGLDRSGVMEMGNHRDGVFLDGASGNLIGVMTAGFFGGFNTIGGNGQDGVEVAAGSNAHDGSPIAANGNQILGNAIGTDVGATLVLGNGRDGVRFTTASNNITRSNFLAYNGVNGVTVGASPTDTSAGDVLDDNGIFGNSRLGIDLGNDGVTPNTPGGPHAGPNQLQNFPVLVSTAFVGDRLVLTGTLDSTRIGRSPSRSSPTPPPSRAATARVAHSWAPRPSRPMELGPRPSRSPSPGRSRRASSSRRRRPIREATPPSSRRTWRRPPTAPCPSRRGLSRPRPTAGRISRPSPSSATGRLTARRASTMPPATATRSRASTTRRPPAP